MKLAKRIIYIVLIAVFAVAAFNIGKTYYNYHKADNTYGKIQDTYVSFNTEPQIPEETLRDEPQQTISQTQPVEVPEPPITIDFSSLLERNSDVVAWLYCPDTVVSYPVVQGVDNDQYLHRDLDGNYLVSGTLFADYRNSPLEQGSNYIVYGHNMKNGTMFSMLTKYKSQSYYDKHPVMYYLTPAGSYRLELFAGLVVDQDDEIYRPDQSQAEVHALLSQYRARSTFRSDVELAYNDTIITLSTCSYESDHARYIVIGRLIPL